MQEKVMPDVMTSRFSQFWTADKGLSMFLGLLCVLLFVFPPMQETGIVGSRLIATLFALVLVTGAARAAKEKASAVVVITSAFLALITDWAVLFIRSLLIATLRDVLLFLTFCLFAVVILRSVFREGGITLHRVFGAVSVYLLLAVMWVFAYHLVYLRIPGAIRFADPVWSKNSWLWSS